MPRLREESKGTLEISDRQASALLTMLRQVGETTNDRRMRSIARHLSTRCQTILDEAAAADAGMSLAEYLCPGHEWSHTGTAYGGDDERYHGEGRCFCIHCGADGDG